MRSLLCAIGLLAAGTFTSSLASAQQASEVPVAAPTAPSVPATTEFRFATQLGGFASTTTGGGLIGYEGAIRWHVVQAGLLLQAGGWIFFDNASSAALTAGFSVPVSPSVRLDLLGLFGARWYTAVGQEVFDQDPGTSASVGYTGAMWGVSYVFPHSHPAAHNMIGLWGSFEEDLARVVREYSYRDLPGLSARLLGIEAMTVERRRVIGATRASIVFTYGVLIDL